MDECFGSFIPASELAPSADGVFSRRRLFSKVNTFWAFFFQVLGADDASQEVVRKVQAFNASQALSTPSKSTAAYCKGRSKLEQSSLENILSHTAHILQQRRHGERWKDRQVIVVDGTGVSMPDTTDNKECMTTAK